MLVSPITAPVTGEIDRVSGDQVRRSELAATNELGLGGRGIDSQRMGGNDVHLEVTSPGRSGAATSSSSGASNMENGAHVARSADEVPSQHVEIRRCVRAHGWLWHSEGRPQADRAGPETFARRG